MFGMGTGGPSALKTLTSVHSRTPLGAPSGTSFAALDAPWSPAGKTTIQVVFLHALFDSPLEHFGAPSGTRTPDPLIKSQLLYQLS